MTTIQGIQIPGCTDNRMVIISVDGYAPVYFGYARDGGTQTFKGDGSNKVRMSTNEVITHLQQFGVTEKQIRMIKTLRPVSYGPVVDHCDRCGRGVDQNTNVFSQLHYGKPLCIPCQKKSPKLLHEAPEVLSASQTNVPEVASVNDDRREEVASVTTGSKVGNEGRKEFMDAASVLLTEMKVPALRERACLLGVRVSSRTRKAQLIDLITMALDEKAQAMVSGQSLVTK